jgi:hypothetical protein
MRLASCTLTLPAGRTDCFCQPNRIDRWCEQQKELQGMTIRPSRPAAIRWIVHQFLLKQERSKPREAGVPNGSGDATRSVAQARRRFEGPRESLHQRDQAQAFDALI